VGRITGKIYIYFLPKIIHISKDKIEAIPVEKQTRENFCLDFKNISF